MVHKRYNPKSVAKPITAYSQVMEAAAGAHWLCVSGQVGIGAKGKLSGGIKGQCGNSACS